MSSIIINNLPNIKEYSYLELGVNDNVNFNKITAKLKVSADVNGNATFTGTTDEYFATLAPSDRFDIIFIDACHDYEYVLRDFNNAVTHATKWILLHDMIPPSKKHTQSKFCSDSYKILYYMLDEQHFEIYPMDNNFGLTLIKMPAVQICPPDLYKDITYAEFVEFMAAAKLYSDAEIIDILGNENV